jgi:hypothetical protein
MHLRGQAFKKNYAEAASCFRAAAKFGDPFACFHLARMMYKGIGVEKDAVEASAWHWLGWSAPIHYRHHRHFLFSGLFDDLDLLLSEVTDTEFALGKLRAIRYSEELRQDRLASPDPKFWAIWNLGINLSSNEEDDWSWP